MEPNRQEFNKCDSANCCSFELNRRGFMRMVGAGTLAALGSKMPLMAGPFDNDSFDANIPADKKLDPAWVKSLFERGTPETLRGAQLKEVRMPIGGICAGHVDLSGDGVMTVWRMNDFPLSVKQGFALRTVANGEAETMLLNRHDFPDLTFRGEYPIAKIEYPNAAMPVQVSLEAFSPFIPLDADDSGLPVTIFNFTLKNTSAAPVEVTVAGGLQNGVCSYNRFGVPGTRRNQIIRSPELTVLNCTAEPGPDDANAAPDRPEVIFEDWNRETFDGWTVEGTAFGSGPIERDVIEKKMGKLGGPSPRVVNSYFLTKSNAGFGKLTSVPFTVQRRFINIWIGGGDLEGKTCVNLVVDGKTVQSQTGTRLNKHSLHCFDLREFEGKQATIEIVDASEGDWGQISVGRIAFSDVAAPLDQFPDFGTMALALLGAPAQVGLAKGSVGFEGAPSDNASVPLSEELIGTLGRTVQLKPGESKMVTFVAAWHFPNLTMDRLGKVGCYYAKKFDSAQAVAAYVAANFNKLAATTRLWRDTWYDSTLPYWFLDRTLLNVSTLATSGCFRFANGRFYAYEGGDHCCPGTCTHVWQYAHSMSRIFPELERDTRERVDLGLSLMPNGVSGFRAEYDMNLAVDGQAGTILRIYREHQMSPDEAFLKRNWTSVKKMFDPLFALDAGGTGILDGKQMNTLDRAWYGKISWMSSMYVAALRAGEQMALETGDTAFAEHCRGIAEKGTRNIPSQLFNGEYFINLVDPSHPDSVNSGTGSHIDQVYGQSWAFQVGLPRVLPEKETRSALQSLWKYNFSPDAGAYFTAHKEGRRFVWAGDAGMIMCTFPRPDWDYKKASGVGNNNDFAYYFNETWTGNEYQVASHMLWEGMLLEGMAMVRAIHDRYNPLKRSPWSEIECGGHYARAMASHGAFVAMCGFEYHGPKGHIGFAPRLTPEKFRAPFTSAEGWGTYSQSIENGKLKAAIEVKWGKLKLKSLALAAVKAQPSSRAQVVFAGKPIGVHVVADGDRRILQLEREIELSPGQSLDAELYS